MTMTTTEFANLLDGRTIGNEITNEEKAIANQHGLIVIYGASDDLMEFEGAMSDEVGVFTGGKACFTKEGVIMSNDDDEIARALELLKDNGFDVTRLAVNEVEAVWDETVDFGEGDIQCSWQYKTEIPHEKFRIYEDTDLYCVGIVISVNDLK
jgi:hypothetical protein